MKSVANSDISKFAMKFPSQNFNVDAVKWKWSKHRTGNKAFEWWHFTAFHVYCGLFSFFFFSTQFCFVFFFTSSLLWCDFIPYLPNCIWSTASFQSEKEYRKMSFEDINQKIENSSGSRLRFCFCMYASKMYLYCGRIVQQMLL